jgi:hypothetical protein
MMEDFIRIWPGKVSPEDCQETIDSIEWIISNPGFKGHVINNNVQFSNGSLGRADIAVFLQNPVFHKADLCSKYLYYLNDCLTEYIAEFSQLKDLNMTNNCELKLQKTPPRGGFHIWHYENGGIHQHSRELTWMIYLNDMPEGEAETEFLFQHRKVRPTRGTVVIWPAGMTHVHRGNTVYTQPKYILTGWYNKI